MAQIINFRQFKQFNTVPDGFKESISKMDKMELLEQMVLFQQERAKEGYLTDSLIARGKVIFFALEKKSETQELRMLVRSYLYHLETEETVRRMKRVK